MLRLDNDRRMGVSPPNTYAQARIATMMRDAAGAAVSYEGDCAAKIIFCRDNVIFRSVLSGAALIGAAVVSSPLASYALGALSLISAATAVRYFNRMNEARAEHATIAGSIRQLSSYQ